MPGMLLDGVCDMNFSVSIRQADDISVVELKGHLTSFELGALREAIQGLLKQGRISILLNLSSLEYLDSSGIGELVRSYMSVVKRGGTMKVVGLGPKVEAILRITQLHQVFQEFPDEQTAMQSFPASGAGTLLN